MAIIQTADGEFELSDNEAKCIDFKGYLGNQLLKRAGVKIGWTEESLAEYAKCAQDPIYFIETYMKIIHVDYGLVPFKLRSYQLQLIINFHENRRLIVNFCRQSGKSVAVIGYLLWYFLFNSHKTVMLLANKAQTAREILGKLQLAYLHLPKFLQQGVVEWNKGSVVLENGSRAIAEATSSDAIRGYTTNILVLDEAAHVENWEEFSKSVLPTITSGQTTKIVMISTPKGLNHFYQTWELAQHYDKDPQELPEGIKWNGYIPQLVTWKEVPGRDQKWYDDTLAELNFDLDKFNQEFFCQFLGSSGTLIGGWKLQELVAKIPVYHRDNLRKYQDVKKEHMYVLTADVSEGKGLDYSAFQVSDVTTMPFNQVCSFKSNLITPHEFAQIIHQTAVGYNNAYVLIEYENLGPEVADTLFHDLSYDHLIHTESAGPHGKRISMGGGKNVDKGIKMSSKVKSTGCSLLKLLIEQNQYIINDHHTIEELARFSRKGKSYQAEEGYYDDLTMSLVVFAWFSNQDYFKDLTNNNTLQKLRDRSIEEIEESLTPFGFIQAEEVPAGDLSTKENFDEVLLKAFRDQDAELLPNF